MTIELYNNEENTLCIQYIWNSEKHIDVWQSSCVSIIYVNYVFSFESACMPKLNCSVIHFQESYSSLACRMHNKIIVLFWKSKIDLLP